MEAEQMKRWRPLIDTVHALDSTTIDLCLSLFPWARFRSHKAAVKLHTLVDLRGSIPTFVYISNGKVSDVMQSDRVYSMKDEYRRMLWCSKNMANFVEMPVRAVKGLVASQIWHRDGTGRQIEENDQRAMDSDRPVLFRELITCRMGTLERLAIRHPLRMPRMPRVRLGVFACGYPRLSFVS